MARSKDLTGLGFPWLQASALGFSGEATGIVSAGSTYADATQLTAAISVLATVGSGEGVTLPTDPNMGMMAVINGGSNAVLVYPGTGNQVNNATATTSGYSVANGKTAVFFRCGPRILATLST